MCRQIWFKCDACGKDCLKHYTLQSEKEGEVSKIYTACSAKCARSLKKAHRRCLKNGD